MAEQNGNWGKVTQYLNTVLLTIVLGVLAVNYNSLKEIKADNVDAQKELLRIKTIQDINSANIKELQARVVTLETYQQESMKAWVDQNYVRQEQQ